MRGHQPWQTNRSRVLGANNTSAEDALWQRLRARRLGGFKFVRQAPISRYFADFLCRDLKLIVEIDGATHSTEAELSRDCVRTNAMEQLGYNVVRVSNGDIYDNLDGVCETLLARMQGDKSCCDE